jgi:hypothetical protein
MINKDVRSGVNAIAVAVIESIMEDMKALKLDEDSRHRMLELLESKKDDTSFGAKQKRRGPKKREVLEKNQCTHIKDDGKCGAPMCDKELRLCWAHMSKEQQGAYQWKKANKKKNL